MRETVRKCGSHLGEERFSGIVRKTEKAKGIKKKARKKKRKKERKNVKKERKKKNE